MGKDKIVKIWEEADRCGYIRGGQQSAWDIEEFSSLLVAECHQFCSESIDG